MNNYPPSTRIPHPISTQSTNSLTTSLTTTMNEARNSPLSASTATTSGPNAANNNMNNTNNSSVIPPLPNISSSTLQPPSFSNNNNNNNHQTQNNGYQHTNICLPDGPNDPQSTTGSFPPPPTNTTTSHRSGSGFGQPLFSNDAVTNNMNDNMNMNNGMNMNQMNQMNNMNNNQFGNNQMAINGTVTAVDNNGFNGFTGNGIITNAPTYVNTTYNPQMNMQQIPTQTTYNIVTPMNNMNNNMMNVNNMNHMNNMNGYNMMNVNNNQYGITTQQNTVIDDAATQQMNNQQQTYSVISSNNNNNQSVNGNNNNNDPFSDNGDKSKYIDDDLEHGRKNYIELLRSVNFRNEQYQTCASKWIRACLDNYDKNQDIYHNYLLNLVQSLINSIGDDKTVRGLKRTWMSYNNIENEWSFLHMICSKNLLYLFQSILNLLNNYKHELFVSMTSINKDSKLRISPLYCCIINSNHQFTKYLFDYFLTNFQSQDILHVLQNGSNDPSNSLITHLINYNHTQTLQQLININASRSNQFLSMQQVQIILNKIQPQNQQNQNQQSQQQNIDGTYSVNAFSK